MGARLPRGESLLKRQQAFVLSAQFTPVPQIAKELKVSQQTIRKWLKRVESEVMKEFIPVVEQIKVEQTISLKVIAREAFEAWERSKKDAETVSETTGGDSPSTTTTRKGQCGDPRFLGEIRGAFEDIRKIWGAEAPKQNELINKQEPQLPMSVLLERLYIVAGDGSKPKSE